MPLADLERELNSEIPDVLYVIDEPQRVCIRTKSKLLPDITCRLKGRVTRGHVSLSGSGDTLILRMPVNAVVSAEHIGKLIKRETATGALDLTAKVRLGLSPAWQPTAKVQADYSWTNRIGVNFLGQRISFASKVDPKLHALLADLERSLPRHLASLQLRSKVQPIWAKGFTSIRVKSDPLIWVRFTPERIGLSGYRVEGGKLIVGLAAQAKTETIFGDRPESPPVTPVPNLLGALPPKGINVHVPVLVRYGVLEAAARRALARTANRSLALKGGITVDAKFKDVTIYGTPSDELAVGVDMELRALAGSLSPKGKVWFVAKPVVDIPGRTVGITDLKLAGQTDSRSFNLLVEAIDKSSLRERLMQTVHYNFSADYEQGLKKAADWLEEQPFEGFVFKGSLVGAQLKGVRIAPDGLLVEADAQADAAMTYDPRRASVLVAERRARRAAREAAAKATARAAAE